MAKSTAAIVPLLFVVLTTELLPVWSAPVETIPGVVRQMAAQTVNDTRILTGTYADGVNRLIMRADEIVKLLVPGSVPQVVIKTIRNAAADSAHRVSIANTDLSMKQIFVSFRAAIQALSDDSSAGFLTNYSRRGREASGLTIDLARAAKKAFWRTVYIGAYPWVLLDRLFGQDTSFPQQRHAGSLCQEFLTPALESGLIATGGADVEREINALRLWCNQEKDQDRLAVMIFEGLRRIAADHNY